MSRRSRDGRGAARTFGAGGCATTSFAGIISGTPFATAHKIPPHQNLSLRLRLLRRRHLIRRASHATFPSQHLTFGQVRKALLRIKILCQHNKSKVKSNSDHRNSYFTGTPAAGAGDRWSPLRVFLSISYKFPRAKRAEARPVISAITNTPFLIERTHSVQSGDF